MNIEKQVAEQVRKLSDAELAQLALNAGFKILLAPKANGMTNGSNGKVKHSIRASGAQKVVKAIEAVEVKAAKVARAASGKKAAKDATADTKHPMWAVLACLQKKDGMAISQLAANTNLTRAQAQKGLKVLLREGKAFKAGERRFTRYADTKKKAADASIAARG